MLALDIMLAFCASDSYAQYTSVASTLVRDVLKNGGDVTQFLPDVVAKSLERKK